MAVEKIEKTTAQLFDRFVEQVIGLHQIGFHFRQLAAAAAGHVEQQTFEFEKYLCYTHIRLIILVALSPTRN